MATNDTPKEEDDVLGDGSHTNQSETAENPPQVPPKEKKKATEATGPVSKPVDPAPPVETKPEITGKQGETTRQRKVYNF